ncbi:hypothetical protein Glove_564g9 [Diversispora epigaea]|uniref:Uncharacterized protein n=1 Tax=Diversispora epigaea TaxID=1348612 RepID=A0A397GAE4_9GLOM|nr:hypothetical protein Glove_564g9 [Diversispora epigaea]
MKNYRTFQLDISKYYIQNVIKKWSCLLIKNYLYYINLFELNKLSIPQESQDSLSERSKNENNNFEIYSNTSYNELHDPKLFVFNQEGYNNAYEKLENEIIQQLDDNRDDIDLLEDTEAITIESTNAEESNKTIIINSLSERSKNENNNFEIYSNTSYNELHDPKLFVFNQEGYNNAYEKFENKIIQQLDNNRDDIDLLEDTETITIESTNAEESNKTIIISEQSISSFLPCVLLDLKDDKLQTYSETKNIKNINQLIGVWQINTHSAIEFEKGNLSLGVCMQHFNYDQRNHRSKIKQIRTIQQYHSWNIFSKNFQVPCTGFFLCNSFCELQGISKKNYDEISRMRYICCECYEVKGGHLYRQPGPGKQIITCGQQDLHIKDVSCSLELLAKWLNHIAKTESEDEKLKILNGMLINLIKLEPSKHLIPLFSQKLVISNIKQKQRKKTLNTLNYEHIFKITTFIVLIIINIAFPTLNIWFSQERTFKYGNIFDSTRNISHTTLRMVSQIKMPFSLYENSENENKITSLAEFLGVNNSIKNMWNMFDEIIDEFLNFHVDNKGEIQYNSNFDMQNIHKKILEKVKYGCLGDPSNIVILESGRISNTDEGIFQSTKMYVEDLDLNEEEYLDIVADQAIHSRLIKLQKQWSHLRPILGQWHTSKDICSVLIVLFSSYGIFNLAKELGVKFLDKLDKVVDYRSTVCVLELIWSAVIIAIRIYFKKNNLHKDNIMESSSKKINTILKIWFLYYQ